MSVRQRFARETSHGVVVALPVEDAHMLPLHAEELALAGAYRERRMRTFTVGRAALRDALVQAGGPAVPLLRTARGAPVLPAGFRGSLSHKDEIAEALVARSDEDVTVGVDVELVGAASRDIAGHVLTEREMTDLQALDAETRALAVLQRFSIKEAFYKAIDPRLQRYVGFLEVDVELRPDGEARFLTRVLDAHAPRAVEGRLWMHGDVIVTSVKVQWS